MNDKFLQSLNSTVIQTLFVSILQLELDSKLFRSRVSPVLIRRLNIVSPRFECCSHFFQHSDSPVIDYFDVQKLQYFDYGLRKNIDISPELISNWYIDDEYAEIVNKKIK